MDKENLHSKYMLESNKIEDGPPVRYQLPTQRVNLDKLSDQEFELRKFTFGKKNTKYENKTILLVGATASGKSTLINVLVNFVMGVKFEDRVWFEIIADEKNKSQSDTQTTAVSIYEVFGFEGRVVPFSLTIIDTPGYGGIYYNEIRQKLRDLFCDPGGVDTLDVVGLVMKVSVNRLYKRTVHMLNSLTSIFGLDLENNIVTMITHSEGMKPTDAIQALEDAKIKCARDKNHEPVYFLFNNCQSTKVENTERLIKAARYAFETSEDYLKEFTEFLGNCTPQTPKFTKGLLEEKITVQACFQNIIDRVKTIEMKQGVITKNKEELKRHKHEMETNTNFEIEALEIFTKRETIMNWWDPKAVSCLECKETCHYPGCTWTWNPSWCEVMKDGRCTVCSGKCSAKDHVRENWRYVTETRKVTKTTAQMKAKYDQNRGVHEHKTTLPQDLEKEMVYLQQTKNQYLDEAFSITERLEIIALNSDSMFTFVHLDFLIEKMKEKGDTEKVNKLERTRDRMDERKKDPVSFLKMKFVKN